MNHTLNTQESSSQVRLYEMMDTISAELLHELDDSERALLIEQARTLKQVVKFFSRELVKKAECNVFRIFRTGDLTVSDLISMTDYDVYDRDIINDNIIRLSPYTQMRTIEFLSYYGSPTTEYVISTIKEQSFERPVVDDVFYFGYTYPHIQLEYPIVFLHEPIIDRYGNANILILSSDEEKRELQACTVDINKLNNIEWSRNCRFAVCRSVI